MAHNWSVTGHFPAGVNAHVAVRLEDGALRVRHLRAGRGETQACGSGAVACAAVEIASRESRSPITRSRSRRHANVHWAPGNPAVLEGPAEFVGRPDARTVDVIAGLAYADGRGRIYYDEAARTAGRCRYRPRAGSRGTHPRAGRHGARAASSREPVVTRGRARGRTGARCAAPGGLYAARRSRVSRAGAVHRRFRFSGIRSLAWSTMNCTSPRRALTKARTGRPAASPKANSRRLLDRRLADDPGNAVLAQLALVLARVRLLYGAKRVPRAGRSRAAGLTDVQRALRGLHLRTGAGGGHPFAPVADPLRSARSRSRAHRVRHLERVPGGIVSFGQGCEGEPLLAGARDREHDRGDPRCRRARGRSTSTPTAA